MIRRKKAFTLIELLVVITIIGILAVLVAVTIGPIQKRSRDSKRKADVDLVLGGANQFYADFKVYPNFTMYLGNNTADMGAVNSSFDIGTDVAKCGVLASTAAGYPGTFASLVTDSGSSVSRVLQTAGLTTVANYDNWTLQPGFNSVNNFLVCLKYIDRVVTDSTNLSTTTKFQYKVNYDYTEVLVSAQLENSSDKDGVSRLFTDGFNYGTTARFFEGNGKTNRQLDEDSNSVQFYNTGVADGAAADGRYAYQCMKTVAGADTTKDARAESTYEPIVITSSGYARNSACYGGAGASINETYIGVDSF